MGYGTGVSYINVNRNIIDPKTRRWWEGPNYDGPSDKTVAVMKFESLTGRTRSRSTTTTRCTASLWASWILVSADAPGTTSKYIEDSLDNKIVALWSSGAAGDQNPIYFQQTFDLRDIRIKDYAKRGLDISNAMPPGGQGLNKKDPEVMKLMDQQKQMIQSRWASSWAKKCCTSCAAWIARIRDVQIVGRHEDGQLSGPRREPIKGGRVSRGHIRTPDPVEIRLGLLKLGDIMIGAVNAEVFNPIAQRLKKESPYARTMMATLTNGMARSGYIPNDAAYGMDTFEVVSSRLKPGCAECAIVNGILDLMANSGR